MRPAHGSESTVPSTRDRFHPPPSIRLFEPTEGRRSRPDRGDLQESTRIGSTSTLDPSRGRLSNSTRQRVEPRLSPKDAQPDACIERSGVRPAAHQAAHDFPPTRRATRVPTRVLARVLTCTRPCRFSITNGTVRTPHFPDLLVPPLVSLKRASPRQATTRHLSPATIPASDVDPAAPADRREAGSTRQGDLLHRPVGESS